MFRIVSYTADYCVKPLELYVQDRVIYSRLLCETIRAVCSGSCQSYTTNYCVKPLELYVQDRVIYSRLLCEASQLLCEAIRAVCSGSCHI